MSSIAHAAVLVPSSSKNSGSAPAPTGDTAAAVYIKGPAGDTFSSPERVLAHYGTLGFQASHWSRACRVAERMLQRQDASKIFVPCDETNSFVEIPPLDANQQPLASDAAREQVYPAVFAGVAANLMGTGCRESLRFLVQEGVIPRHSTTAERKTHGMNAEEEGEEEEDVPPAVPVPMTPDFTALRAEVCEANSAFHSLAGHHSFLAALVLGGGGPEHDLRRACGPYRLAQYASDTASCATATAVAAAPSPSSPTVAGQLQWRYFGNVAYPVLDPTDAGSTSSSGGSATSPARTTSDEDAEALRTARLFDLVMRHLVSRLLARQASRRSAAAQRPTPPEAYLDVCQWDVTPSEVWALAGFWLVSIFEESLTALSVAGGETMKSTEAVKREAQRRAESTVLYWAARQHVPIYSPSFTDGDIMSYVLPRSASAYGSSDSPMLRLDLVRDVHGLNRMAMLSKNTAMLICGGGVVKHHVCNANLMRNGADYAIIFSNAQEYDGSDAGARPEEAVSWGKVRIDGESVKVYGEVTVSLALLVGHVFVPAVRKRKEGQAGAA